MIPAYCNIFTTRLGSEILVIDFQYQAEQNGPVAPVTAVAMDRVNARQLRDLLNRLLGDDAAATSH